jgi:hypothetical protein
MKYVLLIFGILLGIAGAVSIYTGYGIIEVERGWASVIAGATALTGGAIIIALAWILGSLEAMRTALETGELRPSQSGAQPTREEPVAADLPVAPVTASARESVQGQQREEPVFGHALAEPEEIAERQVELPPAPAVAVSTAPEPQEAKNLPLSRASAAFITAAAKARNERRNEPSISELWKRVGVNLDAAKDKPADPPEGARPSVGPIRQAREKSPEAEGADWLDQAMARFDEPVASETAEEAPPLAPKSSERRESSEPEVIGRYEAEGTAYVMYADGSIDAQSEQEILRFRSLADLKAYFQS